MIHVTMFPNLERIYRLVVSRVRESGRLVEKVRLIGKHMRDSRGIEDASIRLKTGVDEIE